MNENAQLDIVKTALTRIAKSRKTANAGGSQRICRTEMETIAREACDVMGWPYTKRAETETETETAR